MDIERVFITGSAGFIGSHLTRRLVENGFTVGIGIREQTNCSRIIDLIDQVEMYHVDIRDSTAVEGVISDFDPDIVLHLVTYYAVEHKPAEIGVMVDTNVKCTVNLLEAVKEVKVPYFVNTSTCAVYRDSGSLLAEEDPLDPQNLYALTKLQAEEACTFYAENYDINAVTLRLFPPYGPADHERRLIPYVIRTLMGGESPDLTTGRQRWDFVYVEDIVDAYLAAIASFPYSHPHEIFNIGTGKPSSIRDVVETIKRTLGSDVALRWGSVPHRKNEVWFNSADIRKSHDILGWLPKTTIDEGIPSTVAWFEDYWQKDT